MYIHASPSISSRLHQCSRSLNPPAIHNYLLCADGSNKACARSTPERGRVGCSLTSIGSWTPASIAGRSKEGTCECKSRPPTNHHVDLLLPPYQHADNLQPRKTQNIQHVRRMFSETEKPQKEELDTAYTKAPFVLLPPHLSQCTSATPSISPIPARLQRSSVGNM